MTAQAVQARHLRKSSAAEFLLLPHCCTAKYHDHHVPIYVLSCSSAKSSQLVKVLRFFSTLDCAAGGVEKSQPNATNLFSPLDVIYYQQELLTLTHIDRFSPAPLLLENKIVYFELDCYYCKVNVHIVVVIFYVKQSYSSLVDSLTKTNSSTLIFSESY